MLGAQYGSNALRWLNILRGAKKNHRLKRWWLDRFSSFFKRSASWY